MAKAKLQYQCTACGALHSKWSGQCSDCGEWNSLTESIAVKTPSHPRFSGYAGQSNIQNMADIELMEEPRTATGIGELDRVLGGGLVHGSVILIGGDPGIGKSTLLTQTLATLGQQMKALYVTGEESLQQVTLRAKRLGLGNDPFRLLTETCVERILDLA
ncbi:MAG: DNA repair protein RadA, partial [Gammaproteobacteria bacterium]